MSEDKESLRTICKKEFERIEFIPYLLKYFALKPSNKVTLPGMFPNVEITYYQDVDKCFHKVVDTHDGEEPIDFTLNDLPLSTILAIIGLLEDAPSTMDKSYGFKNMKEQVRIMSTAYTML